MKKIKYIIPSLVVLSSLVSADVSVDSLGAHLGYSNFKTTQTNMQGSITLAKQPDEGYLYGELYILLNGAFEDKSIKPTLNYMISKNSDFLNNTLMAGVNKYHYFESFDVYYGALLGYGFQNWDYNPINNTKDNKNKATSFVGAVQLGVEYPVTKKLFLDFNAKLYKHNYETRLEPSSGVKADINHPSSYSLAIGLRYAFGSVEKKEVLVLQEEPVKEEIVPEQRPEPVVKKPVAKPVPVIVPVVVLPKDSDGDGILDKDDICHNTPKGFSVDENGCEVAYNLEIKFKSSSSKIEQEYTQTIEKFVLFLKNFPKYKVNIEAYTDSLGTKSSNQKLSEKRAKSVYKRIIELGISKERMSYKGMGDTNPIASNTSSEGREKNRRVVAVLEK